MWMRAQLFSLTEKTIPPARSILRQFIFYSVRRLVAPLLFIIIFILIMMMDTMRARGNNRIAPDRNECEASEWKNVISRLRDESFHSGRTLPVQ